jgi:predicted O-methyltransferase YrrM
MMTMNDFRSLPFKERLQGRYLWFQSRKRDYVPAVFALLTDSEWQIMEEWYSATDIAGNAGEAGIPAISFMNGIIEGSSVPNIVQLGHYQGFSTLLLGFAMRRMGFARSIFTIDINEYFSNYIKYWIDKASLADYICVNTASSDDPALPKAAKEYFGSEVASIFIDSSHEYAHTLKELRLWFPVLQPFGLMFLHDASVAASDFDSSGGGGVIRAFNEWTLGRGDISSMLLNRDVIFGKNPSDLHGLVYQDGCGLGIIQKRSVLAPL